MKTVLLLGGTADARALATAFAIPGARLVASLAGATEHPHAYPCPTRHGSFGGAQGLREYLQEGIVAVIDATHPFATVISRNAAEACTALALPFVSLSRPPWPAIGDWRPFPTLERAVDALPGGARVLATTGRKDVTPYIARSDLTVHLRSVDPVPGLPAYIVPIASRGPFTLEAERALMTRLRITHLVTRNSGGESRARVDAAAALDLPLHIVERPPPPAAPRAHSVADALRWLETVLRD